MRIALISFEFPPAVAIGGIGTYAWEAARMLAEAGHDIEVFAAGITGYEPANTYGIKVHRIDVTDRAHLREAVVPVFAARHNELPFDVLESPEIGAEGAGITSAFPDIAVVVKLHTPTYLVSKFSYEPPPLRNQVRFLAGSLRRGRIAWLHEPSYDPASDIECLFTRVADVVAAPSYAIGTRVTSDWNLDPSRLTSFPCPFRQAEDLIALPLSSELKTVGFLGRLEARKGVVELARAIPSILQEFPKLRFRFIGPTWPYQQSDMESWIRHHCKAHVDNLHFVGAVSRAHLAAELAACDTVILPSRWESFGLVCPESMTAGRAVIGSSAGGMAEIIEDGISGLLVPPNSPESITRAVLSLAKNPDLVTRLAEAGRQRVLDLLAPSVVLPFQVAAYRQAIERSKIRRNETNLTKP